MLQDFQIDLLETRRSVAAVSFAQRIISGDIDCKFVLENLNIYVPRLNSKARATFYLPASKKNVYRNAPLTRIAREVNRMTEKVDIFHTNRRKDQI